MLLSRGFHATQRGGNKKTHFVERLFKFFDAVLEIFQSISPRQALA
jgi:hypothetical protein